MPLVQPFANQIPMPIGLVKRPAFLCKRGCSAPALILSRCFDHLRLAVRWSWKARGVRAFCDSTKGRAMASHYIDGPWQADMGAPFLIWNRDGRIVAQGSSQFAPDIKRAHAYLIATAPDLLEALDALLEWLDGYLEGEIVEQARRARDRATGRFTVSQ